MSVLVTGGCGYIGSHIVLELIEKNTGGDGDEVIVVDNLSNSTIESINKITTYTGKNVNTYIIDLIDTEKLRDVFRINNITSVIHLAGFKAVGESYDEPLMYYDNNLRCTISLLNVMKEFNVKNIIFSSSATVYGIPKILPLDETHSIAPTNPYGQTKRMIEIILEDIHRADNEWNITILRYFNPVGAHHSGIIGDNPTHPNNLFPYVIKVIDGTLPHLNIFGNDYDTPDGTPIRDYIHVHDLARGHVCAMGLRGLNIYNLGTGIGYSVLDVLNVMETVLGDRIHRKISERRKGDVAVMYADSNKAKKELGWSATHSIQTMCKDTLHFLENN